MDTEQIKRVNREALRAAKEAEGSSSGLDNTQLMMYGIAIAVAVLSYFLLQQYQPAFVMVAQNGQKTFDMTRAIIISVVAGLLVILCYHFCFNA